MEFWILLALVVHVFFFGSLWIRDQVSSTFIVALVSRVETTRTSLYTRTRAPPLKDLDAHHTYGSCPSGFRLFSAAASSFLCFGDVRHIARLFVSTICLCFGTCTNVQTREHASSSPSYTRRKKRSGAELWMLARRWPGTETRHPQHSTTQHARRCCSCSRLAVSVQVGAHP